METKIEESPGRLSDDAVDESCVQILETFCRKVAAASRERGLQGDEPVLLNIMHNGLFGLLMQARLFVPKAEKGKDEK